MNKTTAIIRTGSNGYTAEQVARDAITIQDLIERLQGLLEDGIDPDTKVVSVGIGYGAIYDPITSVGIEEDDEEDEDYI